MALICSRTGSIHLSATCQLTAAPHHRLHPFLSTGYLAADSATASNSSARRPPPSVHSIQARAPYHSHLPILAFPPHQVHLQQPIHPHAPTASMTPGAIDGDDAAGAAYTSVPFDPVGLWNSEPGLQWEDTGAPRNRNALLFQEDDSAALFLDAELRLLANAVSDRAQMHSILAQQRDNWNKLFQRMLTSASMTACVLSGLDGAQNAGHSSLSLALPALLLNAGTAAMMAVINQFQPSQLAEEQRTASRLFHKLASDIHFMLHTAPHLRQHTPLFLHSCKQRLQALDKAFPMPLTPGGLDKFPAKVVPPILIDSESIALYKQNLLPAKMDHNNGWDEPLANELKRVVTLLDSADIPKYTSWAQNLVLVNKSLAVAAPSFAALAALLNGVVVTTSTSALSSTMGVWAAVCSVLAAFANSFSNDMQLGMVFELYRNSVGYYSDVKMLIEETLCMPIEQRENGTLFRQRIAYQLGCWPTDCLSSDVLSGTAQNSPPNGSSSTLVPADAKEAGSLF